MDLLNWSLQTSPAKAKRMVVSEYVLNDMGIFVKDEYRMPKKDVLTTITGFRIGYNNMPNTDYHAAPGKRNVILWHKITDISKESETCFIIKGNRQDVIEMAFHIEDREQILLYMTRMLSEHPTVFEADATAANWMCWRDDDEWEDPYGSLLDMIQAELGLDRYVEDIIEDTVLTSMGNLSLEPYLSTIDSKDFPQAQQVNLKGVDKRPKYCSECGTKLQELGRFCHNCGAEIPKND